MIRGQLYFEVTLVSPGRLLPRRNHGEGPEGCGKGEKRKQRLRSVKSERYEPCDMKLLRFQMNMDVL